ncbi:hypothetical protein HED60_08100 [Planctomycetales bacterium ZRK34]|nr:hypothetical protein HED60_08100 [Planctomycetales bacterium ZRK34]
MFFKFACPSCGKNLKVSEEYAGRKARCPYCKSQVAVPKFSMEDVPQAKPRAKDPAEELAAVSSAPTASRRPSSPATSRHTESTASAPSSSGGAGAVGSLDDGTNVSPILTSVVAAIASVAFYFALLPIWKTHFAELFWNRGWVTYAEVFLMAWSCTILFLKYRKLNRQKDAVLFDLLPTEISDEITVDTVPQFTRHIRSLPADPGASFLINRVLRGLEHFRVRRSSPEVANILASQGDIDNNAAHSSYALVKVFTWAIPILGFIGTVIGISAAVGGFSGEMSTATDIGALKDKLGEVTGGLSVAFDTTLVALVMSLLVSIPTTALRKSEEDLLNRVDEYCNENLLKRINDDESQIASGGNAQVIRKAIEQAMTAHHAELQSWTEKLQSIGGTLTDEIVRGWTDIFKQIDESQEKQTGAHRDQLDHLQKMMTEITERADRVEKDTSDSIRTSADALQGHFKAMTEGITALNHVLTQLGEKQVVIHSNGRRGWWPFGRRAYVVGSDVADRPVESQPARRESDNEA